MVVLYAFLIVVEVISAALLIGVIFLQKSSGAGMGTAFGGAGESIFGSRMGNVLTKATVVLAAIFLANTTMLAWIGARRQPASVVERVPLHEGPGVPAGRPMPPAEGDFLADPDGFDGELRMDAPDAAVEPAVEPMLEFSGDALLPGEPDTPVVPDAPVEMDAPPVEE